MKNLKVNNNCFDFLRKNKTRICATALAGIMLLSLTACGSNEKTNVQSNHQINEVEILNNVKSRIENNIDNVIVTKDIEKGYYIITENSVLEIPYYDTDDKGNLIVTHVETQDMGTSTYNVTFEEAATLNLTELLESKLAKTK